MMTAPHSTLSTLDTLLSGIKRSSGSTHHRTHKRVRSKPESVRAFDHRNQLIVASQYVLSHIGTAPIAIVLGSGLGGFAAKLHDVKELEYSKIPFLPQPTVKGHSGKIIMGYLKSKDDKTKKRIMCFSGRLHCYEGYPMFQLVFCARLSYLCGVHSLILTNAAGGCIRNQKAGSVIIMTDYVRDVSYKVLNHSENDSMFGVRHMRGDKLLDKELTNLLLETAKQCDYPHYTGTYFWANGPFYETASHVRYAMKVGAHALGMSTVPSILAAANIGLKVAAMSLCTNVAAGLSEEELDHNLVVESGKAASFDFGNFVQKALVKIKNPTDYDNSYKSVKHFKLNLTKLQMTVDTASIDEYIYPRKHLGTYNDLYKDIAFIRSFLGNVLDLSIAPMDIMYHQYNDDDNDNDNDDEEYLKYGDEFKLHIVNRDGPIPIWILHEPFQFDTTTLQCPISMPLKTLWGFAEIATSSSARAGVLNFGFDSKTNLIVIITGLSLGGFSFDESNYIINLLYGVLGHKNLYFTNMFYAFPTNTMYSDHEQKEDEEIGDDNNNNNIIRREQYALIKDSIDFKGGFPRFPRPLFPPKQNNTSDCFVRMKYGTFGNTKKDNNKDSEKEKTIKCLFGFKSFFDKFNGGTLNDKYKTNIYSYAYWPGPSFPTPAELNIGLMGECELSGISDPFMTPMSRQLGHDGYSVAYIPSIKEFNALTKEKGRKVTHKKKDITIMVYSVSLSIIKFFGKTSSSYLFSPASMSNRSNNRNQFEASLINNNRLYQELNGLNIPFKAPQYQPLHTVQSEWHHIDAAAEWLKKAWNFKLNPIINVLFSSFSHFSDHNKFLKYGLISIDLADLPGWKEHFCGGFPYSHYHWNNHNPFEWTLKIYKSSEEQEAFYYMVIAPHFFTNTKLHPQRYHDMTSFYKYTPRFWNLSFILRVLWKLGIKNVCFLSHLISNNCLKNKENIETLSNNNVVLINNYVECARWNILTGPNDDRMGPRFIPITEPVELNKDFIKIIESSQFGGNIKMKSVITVHIPFGGTISSSTSTFYGSLGYQTRSLGLIPMIQTAQHLGLKKVAIGITDYTVDEKLKNIQSFDQIIKIIQILFAKLQPNDDNLKPTQFVFK